MVGDRLFGALRKSCGRSVTISTRLAGRLVLLGSGVWTSAPLRRALNF